MNRTLFKSSSLILSILILDRVARAEDFSERVDGLKKSQGQLDQMILPYRGLSGFRDSQSKSGNRTEEDQQSHILQFHNSPVTLQAPTGKLLYGRTLNRLVIGSDKSPAIILLNQNQKSFSGLRLMALASQSSTPGRISVEAQKVVFRSGVTKAINGIALDQDGALGVEAQVISQKALTVAGAMASSFVSGLAASQQTVSSNAFGFETTQRTSRNALLGGLAQTAADQSKRLIEEATAEKPVLILEAGAAVTIFLQDEVRF